ncbi:MAG: hypothetical protein AAFP69_22705, partial [Planctomycetota bacterium]
MGNFRHVSSGEPVRPSATEHNAMLDAAIAYMRSRPRVRLNQPTTLDPSIVNVRLTGSDINTPAGRVVHLQKSLFGNGEFPDDPASDEAAGFPDHRTYDAILPTPETSPGTRGRYAMLTRSPDDAGYAPARITGHCATAVTVVDRHHRRARVLASGHLQSA